MDLQIICSNLLNPRSLEDLVHFIQSNQNEIEGYFVSLTEEQIENEKFELHRVCLEFINSTIFRENKTHPDFIQIITLFAGVFEKIGIHDAIAVIRSFLPQNSSIRHRLNAVYLYSRIGDPKEYIEKFDEILESLQKAQDFAEADYTTQVIRDLVKYYLQGKKNISQNELLSKFEALFNDTQYKQKFKFLNHPTFKEYLEEHPTDEIFVKPIANKVYVPSPLTLQLFEDLIVRPTELSGYLKKYHSNEIRADILGYGRADFNKPYKSLSPYDRVQLYCYFNMRKHFFTSYAIYERIFTSLNKILNILKSKKLTFIDLGCGPLTSGLALASLHYDKENKPLSMRYIGIDIAESMLKKAEEFSKTKLFDHHSMFLFYTNWDLIPPNVIKEITQDDYFVIFNASYLFASTSLDEKSLANFVNTLTSQLKNKSYFVFQNPNRADRNEKYKNFKNNITHEVQQSDVHTIYYRNSPNSPYEPSYEKVYYEILSL